jgi:hypothetical protein
MFPDAGSFQLVASGDRLISGDGYLYKWTAYQNTLLVDGIGQTGEDSVWFESLDLRRERRAPSILRAEGEAESAVVVANAAPAYEKRAGLTRFLRHVHKLSPTCWVIVDEVAAARPATFELLFHSDFPFEPQGGRAWTASGSSAALRLTSLLPGNLDFSIEVQDMAHTNSTIAAHYPLLRLRNADALQEAVVGTVLDVSPDAEPPSVPEKGGATVLSISVRCEERRLRLVPERGSQADPILTPLE